MITESTASVFPGNAVSLIASRLSLLDPDLGVHRRQLKPTDEVQAVGVYGTQWLPNESTYEMRGPTPGASQPTVSRYTFGIQSYVKDMDDERGLNVHSILSKLVRTTLYRDTPLHVALRSLQVEMLGSVERTQRFGVGVQRFISSEIQGDWLFLSTLEFWLETETETV